MSLPVGPTSANQVGPHAPSTPPEGGFQAPRGEAAPVRAVRVEGFNGSVLLPDEKDGPRMKVGAYGLCRIQEARWSPRRRTPTPALIKAAFVSHARRGEPIHLACWRPLSAWERRTAALFGADGCLAGGPRRVPSALPACTLR